MTLESWWRADLLKIGRDYQTFCCLGSFYVWNICICILTSAQKCTSPSCRERFTAMASTSPSELVHPHTCMQLKHNHLY